MRVISSQAIIPRDITDEFKAAASSKKDVSFLLLQVRVLLSSACSTSEGNQYLTVLSILELRTGQLVKDEYFTLFEAVGALEVRFLLLSCLQDNKEVPVGADSVDGI